MKQQKIVLKVEMTCQKFRTKALEIAAKSIGVDGMWIEGERKDLLVVIGHGVDALRLANSLGKNVGKTQILTMAEVKPTKKVEVKPTKKVEVKPTKKVGHTQTLTVAQVKPTKDKKVLAGSSNRANYSLHTYQYESHCHQYGVHHSSQYEIHTHQYSVRQSSQYESHSHSSRR